MVFQAKRAKILPFYREYDGDVYHWVWYIDWMQVELVHKENLCLYPELDSKFRVPPTAFSSFEYCVYANPFIDTTRTWNEEGLEIIQQKDPMKHYATSKMKAKLCNHPFMEYDFVTGGRCWVSLAKDGPLRRVWPGTDELVRYPVFVHPPGAYSLRDCLLGREFLEIRGKPKHKPVTYECLNKV